MPFINLLQLLISRIQLLSWAVAKDIKELQSQIIPLRELTADPIEPNVAETWVRVVVAPNPVGTLVGFIGGMPLTQELGDQFFFSCNTSQGVKRLELI